MLNPKVFIQKIKGFISENPKRAKFIGLIFVAISLPLIVITALTVQNLQQKASVSDIVIITDSSGSPIASTTDPNVFISINLSTSTQWKLPQQPSSYDGFIKQTYAAGESCANIGRNSCPTGESCVYNSCDEEGNCTGVCQAPSQGEPARAQGDYSQLPASTPTPLSDVIISTPSAAPVLDSCSKLNPTLYQCASSCGDLGKEWAEQASWQNISCPRNSNNQNQQCCRYQPILVLKAVSIENADTDGGTGGNTPIKIAVSSGSDIVRIPWKLNNLLATQNQASRTVRVTLIGDALIAPFTATVNLVSNPISHTAPVSSTVPPVSSPINTCPPKGNVLSSYCSGLNSITVFTDGNCGKYESAPFDCSKENKGKGICVSSKYEAYCDVSSKNFDLNGDGVINCKDTQLLLDQYGRKGSPLAADFNLDGKVDAIDYNMLIKNYTPGDTTVCKQ